MVVSRSSARAGVRQVVPRLWAEGGLTGAGRGTRPTVDETTGQGAEAPHRRLAAVLREQILSGRIEPDRPLPSEESLQREHGLGPEDVRRAIRLLSDEGLVYTLPGQGAFVSSRAEETGGG